METPEWIDLLYPELHALASRYLSKERSDHTLQPTALVNEAYLRLHKQHDAVRNAGHFRALAATMMRRVLLDHARRRKARRGEQRGVLVPVDAIAEESRLWGVELLDLDAALTELAQHNPRQSQVVEMRFFGGSTLEEIASSFGVTRRTVFNDWAFARAWLRRELEDRMVDLGPPDVKQP